MPVPDGTAPVRRRETITPVPARRYRGTFDPNGHEPGWGDVLPPGWEGLYFPFDDPLDALRHDGSPQSVGTPPPPHGALRRYAGEDTEVYRPLHVGDEVEYVARAGDLVEKTGRAGRLQFADTIREYRVGGRVAIRSIWHDVFVSPAQPASGTAAAGTPAPAAGDDRWDWREELTLDRRQLFRFSAITFNTHRVHYDADWVRGHEGMPDLLVHGPLTRILLLDAIRRHRPDLPQRRIGFRAIAPVLVDRPLVIEARTAPRGAAARLVGADGSLLGSAEVAAGPDRA